MRKQITLALEAFAIFLVFGFWLLLGVSSVFAHEEIVAQQNCLSDVQIQQSVANSSILPLSEVLTRGNVAKNSKVLPPINVCYVDGELFYQFSVLSKNGNAQKLVLPATLPIS